jgi:acylphosphatase
VEKYNEIIRIFGKVQGVGFRYSAIQAAKATGISGFVCNEHDGSVYIEAEGTKEQIEAFTDWCRKGPSRAIIQELKHFPGPLKNYSSFTIR